ncbi:hypothetical protein Vafri_3361, partial [Volvox africanus]
RGTGAGSGEESRGRHGTRESSTRVPRQFAAAAAVLPSVMLGHVAVPAAAVAQTPLPLTAVPPSALTVVPLSQPPPYGASPPDIPHVLGLPWRGAPRGGA